MLPMKLHQHEKIKDTQTNATRLIMDPSWGFDGTLKGFLDLPPSLPLASSSNRSKRRAGLTRIKHLRSNTLNSTGREFRARTGQGYYFTVHKNECHLALFGKVFILLWCPSEEKCSRRNLSRNCHNCFISTIG